MKDGEMDLQMVAVIRGIIYIVILECLQMQYKMQSGWVPGLTTDSHVYVAIAY